MVKLIKAISAILLILGFALPLTLDIRRANAASLATGGNFVSIPPTRIVDTRNGNSTPYAGQHINAGGTLTVSVPTNIVPSGASAVVANVTVTNTQSGGYLTIWPAGQTQPTASSLNWAAGATVPNLVTVELGTNSQIDFYNGSNGTIDLIVDVEGYYNSPSNTSTSSGSGHYYPLSPSRIVDTRSTSPSSYAGMTLKPAISSTDPLTVQVTGKGGVPGGGVLAIVANVTVTNTTANGGYLTIWPAGQTQPTASNLNWSAGQTVANRITVGLGSNGSVEIYSAISNADVILDINGYYTDQSGSSTSGSLFNATSPTRILDTRNSSPISAMQSLPLSVAGKTPVPAGATAVLTNITEASATSNGGYITVYPNGSAPPLSSDVNFNQGSIVANMDIADLSASGGLYIYNAFGNTNVIVDVFGYFVSASSFTNVVNVVPVNNTINADGVTVDNVSIFVTNSSGVAQAADTLSENTVAEGSTTCGSFTFTQNVTGGNGIASGTYTASSTPGACLIEITDSTGAEGVGVITEVTPQDVLAVSTSVSSLVAGGSGTASVTATLDDSLGNPVSGQVINFSESGNPTSSSCGTLSSMSGTTMANGTVTETYTAASSFGNCVITVSTSATPMTAAVAIAQTPVAPSSTYIVNLAANPSSVPADGVSTSTINVTVRDSNGLPVQDDPINLITTGTCGQSSVQVGMTDAMGSFDTTYTASNVVGSCTVTVTEALSGLTTNTTINQTAPTPVLSLTLTPASVPASASSTSTVGISVNSVNGPIAGDAIVLTTSGASCGSLSTTSTSTNQWGEATVLYTATTSVGVCVISAIENSANQGSSANLIQTNGQPSSWYAVSVAASPTSINGDGSSTSAVTVTVANGSSAVSGDAVVLSVSGESNCGTLNPTQGTTNSAGQITSTYTAGKMNANCTIVATESVTGASGFGSITQLPSITITAVLNGSSPALPLAKVEVGGKYYPLTITIKNALGGPVANAPIQLTAISLTSGVCGTFGYSGAAGISGAVTDVNGQYETVYTPTTSVGYCAFLISSGSTSGQLLAISSDKASSAPSNTVTVYTSPPVIANNGTSTTTVTEFVTNADGLPVANDPAIMIGPSLSSILGGSSCGQIVGNLAGVLPGSTNANGQFTATYQSSTTAKTCIVLASEADTVTGAGGLIVQTASVPTLGTISFSYGSLVIPAGGSTQVITVTLSSNSKPVEGDSISVVSVQPVESGACGTYYQYSNLTNSSGQALIYYLPSSTVGFCIVQISESYTNTSSTFVIDQSEPGATSAFSVIGNLNGSNLTVSVTDSNGIGVQSDPVLVTLSGSGNACSGAAISNNGAGTTGNSPLGSASFSLTLPSGSGCSADIMEADTGATTSVPI